LEGVTAKADFPLIDRRRLLTSAVALPVASIVPIGKSADTPAANGVRSFAMAPEAEAANVCAATATRLAEIARRQRLRNEFGLPLLSVAKELRRMKTAADTETVERFRDALRELIFQKMLARARRQRGDPAWTPKDFCERWQFSRQVEIQLKRLYERVG
jgi:hypothetical protein